LESELHTAGWTFFFLADKLKWSMFGFNEHHALRASVKRLLSSVKSRGLNCLEICEVTTKSFLGVYFVSIFGHPRHIQRSCTLSAESDP
jgi:hypothetical protein